MKETIQSRLHIFRGSVRKRISETLKPTAEGLILPKAAVSTAVVAKLKTAYGEFDMLEQDNAIVINPVCLADEKLEKLILDLFFLINNPNLPLENLSNYLDTYDPKNDSQRELLRFANKLLGVARDDPALKGGLFIQGRAGVGKSHIAVAVTKEAIKLGLIAHFVSSDRPGSSESKLGPGQVWVIDDFNNGYGNGAHLFKSVILNAHERGGVVFVTSNSTYEKLLDEMFPAYSGPHPERQRYEDRTRGMFKVLKIEGDSHREEHAWWKG